MEFQEMLKRRRSVRNYEDTPVDVDTIKAIIADSVLAPNAGNEQPWKFIIVNNRETMRRISDESKKNILARINTDPDDYANKYRGMLESESFNVFYNAPSLVMILGPSERKNLHVDCACAATYFMIAAAERGLGSCWINLGTEIKDPEMIAELGIPEDCSIVAPIILGHPKAIPPVPKRKDPEILSIAN